MRGLHNASARRQQQKQTSQFQVAFLCVPIVEGGIFEVPDLFALCWYLVEESDFRIATVDVQKA